MNAGLFSSKETEELVTAKYHSTLHSMLPLCDHVIIACALTPDTTNLFGETEFKLMKPTSGIINISRGMCSMGDGYSIISDSYHR